MAGPLLKEKNDLDFGSLEPGDLLLVANPTDPWYIRYTLFFWSHVGIVTSQRMIDAIRDPQGEYVELQRWGTVQCAPFKVYAANHDILALRVKCSLEVRQAAVEYAQRGWRQFGRLLERSWLREGQDHRIDRRLTCRS